ncbi:hypothetical protein BGZ94_004398 [Podila epigama]|nr:hypothetical protein BGZ94_004398 [Podila epigama]
MAVVSRPEQHHPPYHPLFLPHILQHMGQWYLDLADLATAVQVCKFWFRHLSPALWRNVDLFHDSLYSMRRRYPKSREPATAQHDIIPPMESLAKYGRVVESLEIFGPPPQHHSFIQSLTRLDSNHVIESLERLSVDLTSFMSTYNPPDVNDPRLVNWFLALDSLEQGFQDFGEISSFLGWDDVGTIPEDAPEGNNGFQDNEESLPWQNQGLTDGESLQGTQSYRNDMYEMIVQRQRDMLAARDHVKKYRLDIISRSRYLRVLELTEKNSHREDDPSFLEELASLFQVHSSLFLNESQGSFVSGSKTPIQEQAQRCLRRLDIQAPGIRPIVLQTITYRFPELHEINLVLGSFQGCERWSQLNLSFQGLCRLGLYGFSPSNLGTLLSMAEQNCPQLEQLTLSPAEQAFDGDFDHLAQTYSLVPCVSIEHLTSLTLHNVEYLPDSHISKLLCSMPTPMRRGRELLPLWYSSEDPLFWMVGYPVERGLQSFKIKRSGRWGALSHRALVGCHGFSLTTLHLKEVSSIQSMDIHLILCDCPELLEFETDASVDVCDMMRSGRSWTCHKLNMFACGFNGGTLGQLNDNASTSELNHVLYTEMAKSMTLVRQLTLEGSDYDDVLDFSLAHGLALLAPLKNLEVLVYSKRRNGIWREEIQWMSRAWPRLHEVEGFNWSPSMFVTSM